MATIKSYNKRLETLKSERSSFIPLWQELSDHHLGYRGRFLTSDRNKGHKRDTKVFNNTSRMAARTLASGMMAGITSPARPWFRLGTSDPELRERVAVKQWLHDVQTIMYEVFSQSNFYNSMHMLYSELGVFATGAIAVYPDFDTVIRCKTYTVGSYMLAPGADGVIDTFYREYELPVSQIVKQFGYDNCSKHVQKQWDSGNTEAWVKLVHVVEPNDDRDRNSPLAKDMPFRSVYYEVGNQAQKNNAFLRKSGFKKFPIAAPRWDVAGEDIYGTDSPGIMAIGDTKALQLAERRKFQILDKIADPPLQGPVSLQNKVGTSLRNGQIVWTDDASKGLKPIYDMTQVGFDKMLETQREIEHRIKRSFYEDLFLMLANTDRRQITAREVAEKHEEKLLMLGPVLERLHSELLDPAIDITFTRLQSAGVLPPPPRELEDVELKVEYISVLAQAQRLVAVGAIERLAGFAGDLASIWPETLHKIDSMQMVDDYAESLGVSPDMVRGDEEAQERLAAQQQAAQQQQQMEQAAQAAESAKTLSETGLETDNMLRRAVEGGGRR